MPVKTLRSFVHEKIPLDLRVDLDILSRRRDLRGEEKQEEIINLFRKYEIDNISQLGPGTNRYGLKLDGFVIKVATDNDGKIDNMKEFKMAKLLFPRVPKTYEVSENGSLLIAEYVQPFDSFTEMSRKADKIRAILTELSAVCLIGDVGITSKNYANWGIRVGTDEVVCLDFAYIYDVTSDLFICRHCHMNSTLVPNKDFTKLVCPNPACGKETLFEDIRAMIPNDYHRQQIGDLSKEGYLMTSSNVLTELTESRSNYLVRIKKKSKVTTSALPQKEDEIEDIKEDEEMSNSVTINAITSQLPPHPYQGLVLPATSYVAGQEPQQDQTETTAKSQVDSSVVEDDSTVVFSATIDPDTKIENFAETSEPEEEETAAVVAPAENQPAGDKKKKLFSDSFIANSHKAISIISNRIINHMRFHGLFDEIRGTMKNKKMYPEEFYTPLQNSIFKSMVEYFQFEERSVPNPSGDGGTHKEYFAVSDIVNADDYPAAKSLKFVERIFNTRKINSCESEDELLDKYHSIYPDEISGFEVMWLRMVMEKLSQKVELRQGAAQIVEDALLQTWCMSYDQEDAEPEEDPEEETFDTDGAADDNAGENEDAEEAAIAAMMDESDISGSYDMQGSGSEYDEDEEEEYREEDETGEEYEEYSEEDPEDDSKKYMSIMIYPEEGMDVVRIETDDAFGDVNIPVYVNFDKVDPTKLSLNVIDPRNGVWDWLGHTAPDLMFRTADPQKYLDMNDEDLEEWQCHIIILSNEKANEDGMCIMGVYMVAGIYIIDSEFNAIPTFDEELLVKMNVVLNDAIGGRYTSHLEHSLETTELIHDEEWMQQFIVYRGDDEDEPEDQDGEDDTEELVIEGSSVVQSEAAADDAEDQSTDGATDIEEAAIAAMNDTESDEDAVEEDTVEEQPAQPTGSGKKRDARGRFVKQEPDEEGTITPRRRRK